MRVAYVSMLARNILLKNYQRVGVKCRMHAKSFLRKRIKDCFAVALKFAFANAIKCPLGTHLSPNELDARLRVATLSTEN